MNCASSTGPAEALCRNFSQLDDGVDWYNACDAAFRLPMQRLLVVDGDGGTRQLVVRGLGAACQVTWVATTREARRLLRRYLPHFVILEARLPDRAGFDLMAALKRRCPRAPIVLVTASRSEAARAAAFRRGATEVLVKPVSAADLRDRVLSMLAPAPGVDDTDVRVKRAARYVDEHYADPLRLETVAKAVGMSLYALSRAFKPVLNVSFSQYRRQVRVARAQELLAGHAYSITEVAHGVGYDLAYFDRVFRHETGVCPTEYRRRLLAPQAAERVASA
jgi:YesN/AraC family two-component response regulator